MKKRVIASVSNNIQTDQRLKKVCNSLMNHDFEVCLVGTTVRGKPELNRPYKTELIPIKFQKTFFFYVEFNLKLFWWLIKEKKKNDILLANDLDTLLPNFIISKLFGLKLVYDSHELFTELPSLKNRKIPKRTWKLLEYILLPRIKYFYTVSESYANWFENQYGNRPIVVMNSPIIQTEIKNEPPKTQLPERNSDEKVLIYQGAINQSRGIDKMIEAMQFVDNAQLWIIGDGPLLKKYALLTRSLKMYKTKVFFLGRVEPSELKKITPLADVGLSLEEDNGLSYRYALPNKIFDYIHAGVPILATYLDEISKIVKENDFGLIIENHNPKHIAEKIKIMIELGKEPYQKRLAIASKDFNWEKDEHRLIQVFKNAE